MRLFFPVIAVVDTAEFLEKVIERYHFRGEISDMGAVAKRVKFQVRKYGAFTCSFSGECREGMTVLITLGKGMDDLMKEYLALEKVTEAYAVEAIGSELLFRCYDELGKWIADKYHLCMKNIIFYGNDDSLPLEKMRDMLEIFDEDIGVSCNRYGIFEPKLSVMFRVVLSEEGEYECSNICRDCSNKKCPDRRI